MGQPLKMPILTKSLICANVPTIRWGGGRVTAYPIGCIKLPCRLAAERQPYSTLPKHTAFLKLFLLSFAVYVTRL